MTFSLKGCISETIKEITKLETQYDLKLLISTQV